MLLLESRQDRSGLFGKREWIFGVAVGWQPMIRQQAETRYCKPGSYARSFGTTAIRTRSSTKVSACNPAATSTPQLPSRHPKYHLYNRDHKALVSGTFGGVGRQPNFNAPKTQGCLNQQLERLALNHDGSLDTT